MKRTLVLVPALLASLTVAADGAAESASESIIPYLDLYGDSQFEQESAGDCTITFGINFYFSTPYPGSSPPSAHVSLLPSQSCNLPYSYVDVDLPAGIEGDLRRAHVSGNGTIGPDDISTGVPGTISLDVSFAAVGRETVIPCFDVEQCVGVELTETARLHPAAALKAAPHPAHAEPRSGALAGPSHPAETWTTRPRLDNPPRSHALVRVAGRFLLDGRGRSASMGMYLPDRWAEGRCSPQGERCFTRKSPTTSNGRMPRQRLRAAR